MGQRDTNAKIIRFRSKLNNKRKKAQNTKSVL